MITDVYSAKVSMYLIKLGPGLHIYQAWRQLVYSQEGLCHLSQNPDIHKRQSWHLHNRKVLAASSKASIHTATKECLSMIYLIIWRVNDLQFG